MGMRKYLVALALVLGFLIASKQARAQVEQNVDISQLNIPQEFVDATGMSREAMQAFIHDNIDKLFQVSNAVGFLRKLGDSQSFTGKGMGVDYASEATYFELGGSINFAMGIDRSYQPNNVQGFPIQGVGLNASLMAGLSLDFLGVPLMIFGNYMKIPTMNYGSMSGSLDNWGVHAQLRLFGPSRKTSALKVLLRWGGIAITSGIDSSHMALGLHKSIKSSFTDQEVTFTADTSGDAAPRFDVNMTTRSIPLEVTTSLRLLTLLTAYGGVGFDWQLSGSNTMELKVNAAMTGRLNQTGTTQDLGSITASAKVSADPSPAKIRGILGAQVNLWLLRIFTQVNVTNSNPMMASLAVGLRLAY
jgi:hypothetical protein